MAWRKTIERILRDSNDQSGQSIREWKIEAEKDLIKVCLNHGDGFILIRPSDAELFVADVCSARDAAISEPSPEETA
jgi:hypothetical protein